MNSKTKGFIYGAIAAASYGMNPLFTLPLYAAGMSVDTVLFYRYFFAVIVLGILMKMQHQSFALRKADILPLVIMGLLFSFSSSSDNSGTNEDNDAPFSFLIHGLVSYV